MSHPDPLKMDRQHNGQEKKNSTTNHDLQNITHKTKDRVTRTPLKTGGQLRCCVRLSSSCSTSVSRRVNLVTNSVISHEWGKDREVFTTRGTNPWWFVTYIFHTGQLSHGGDRKTYEMMTSTYSIVTLDSVTSLLTTSLYEGNHDKNHKLLWSIVSTKRYILHMQVSMLHERALATQKMSLPKL